MTDQITSGDWALESGTWSMERGGVEVRLKTTKREFPVASAMKPGDIVHAMHMRRAPDGSGPAYPPEFGFSPLDGAPLQLGRTGDPVWIPPSGARVVNVTPGVHAVGLKQSGRSIDVPALQRFAPDSDPALEIPLPPPGAYEFFCAPFGTMASVLLAIDTGKGVLFAWLPASESWEPLSSSDKLLSESALPHRAWRAELMEQFNSCLFVPTDNGLALVMPDFASLKYCIEYIGEGAAKGSPIVFEGRVWAPAVDRYGMIQVVNVDMDGAAGAPLHLDDVRDLGEVGRPVAYGRMAVWPCAKGQVRLQVAHDGNVLAAFIPWQASIVPHFEFGSPYLSRAGVLWQLCFSNALDTFVYVALGQPQPEQVQALTPRLSSGTVNYRFGSMQLGDPWLEPEHGDDGAANRVVFPLLELDGGGVLALKMASVSGLTELLHSNDRMRAELMFEDRSSAFTVQTISVPKPWELRLFLYDGALYAYHPAMQRIIGWEIGA